jgi:disulfide bond formation protein DsbB
MTGSRESIVFVYGLYFAWIVSVAATLGSLFLSEVMKFIPCELCWFQRIFMYPLVILLGLACYRGDRAIARYALPLSVTGGLISLYHYGEQKIPGLAKILPCTAGVPCNQDYLNWFGFVTIPLLALIAFVLISIFLWMARERPEMVE